MTIAYDAIVLGGGAAGLFCAGEAGRMGRKIAVLERAEHPGKKILISGGGRCNFTNLHIAPDRYISRNPHFAKSALSRYTAADFIALVEEHGIAWHEKTLGQLFCDGSARQILSMLVHSVEQTGGTILCQQEIIDVAHQDGRFRVTTKDNMLEAPALIVATGGPSIPKMGATAFAYDLARQFRLKVVEPRPALVPLTLAGDEVLFRELSGVSTEIVARCGKASFREAALFTHRGLSGPAILQVSSYWNHGDPVIVDFLPDAIAGWLIDACQDYPRRTVHGVLKQLLPDRLAKALSENLGEDGPLANIRHARLREIEQSLARWYFYPDGTEGFTKAEVTRGGVSTDDLSSRTMEARRVPGLYFIGEAVDVTGWLGGYNFQWAWSSGRAAALAL
ncbi:MAG: NAD(P)/FAD-dependent oxidoreductase [Sphingomonadaceae bacterium]